jgi:hypothetical protein
LKKIEQTQPGDLYAFTSPDQRYTDTVLIVSADADDKLGFITWRNRAALTDGDGAAITSWGNYGLTKRVKLT